MIKDPMKWLDDLILFIAMENDKASKAIANYPNTAPEPVPPKLVVNATYAGVLKGMVEYLERTWHDAPPDLQERLRELEATAERRVHFDRSVKAPMKIKGGDA